MFYYVSDVYYFFIFLIGQIVFLYLIEYISFYIYKM